MTYIFLPLMHS